MRSSTKTQTLLRKLSFMVLVGFSISNFKFGLKAELSRSKVTLSVYCESRDGCDCTY